MSSNNQRGKTTPASTQGSFAPKAGDRSRVDPGAADTARMVAAGVSAEDAARAVAAGLDVEQFVEHSIRNGITLAEAMEAHEQLGEIGYYNHIREEAGCGHAAVLAVFAASDGEDDFETWASDFAAEKQERAFDPASERMDFGKGRAFNCEPGTEVFVETGMFPSTTFVGSSQVYGKVFRRHRMGADDRIVQNPGGRWVATADGRVFAAQFAPQTRHVFERGGPSSDPLPTVGYRCDPQPFAELGERQEPAKIDPDVVYSSMTRFGAMDYVENTGDGL